MTTALIGDDESPARNLMADLRRAHPRVEVLGRAANVAAAVRLVRTRPPDLIFLNIAIPGGRGFDLIPASEKKPHLVFVPPTNALPSTRSASARPTTSSNRSRWPAWP